MIKICLISLPVLSRFQAKQRHNPLLAGSSVFLSPHQARNVADHPQPFCVADVAS